MTDINTLLKEADPVPREDGLSREDAQSMRREMLGAIDDAPVFVPAWRRPFTIAVAAAVMFIVSGIVGHRHSSTGTDSPEPFRAPLDGGSSNATRQLQFATPGGTRIIWIFDQDIRLQESLP